MYRQVDPLPPAICTPALCCRMSHETGVWEASPATTACGPPRVLARIAFITNASS